MLSYFRLLSFSKTRLYAQNFHCSQPAIFKPFHGIATDEFDLHFSGELAIARADLPRMRQRLYVVAILFLVSTIATARQQL